MNEEIEFYIGSGNVFEDLDLPDAEELQLKSALAGEIRLAIKSLRLTRPQAALKLGISKEQLVELLDGKPFEYSVSHLIGYLNRLDRDVTLAASVRERATESKFADMPKQEARVA